MEIHAIKALDDWKLEVLAVPFGGPDGGKDSDGEYFSPRTKTYADQFKTPLIVYYHGLDPNGKPMGEPEVIGQAIEGTWRKDAQGWWITVALDKAKDLARRVWEAAKQGLAKASSGSIAHLVRKLSNGEIVNWPVAEVAIFDTEGKRQPANQYAVALPVMKAVYDQAGIEMPVLPVEAPEPEAEPEAQSGGDAAPAAKADQSNISDSGVIEMDEKELAELVAKQVEERMAKADAAREAKAAEDARVAEMAALKAEKEALEAKLAEAGRLPDGKTPVVAKFGDLRKYDNLDAADLAVMLEVMKSKGLKPSEAAYKALAIKMDEDKTVVGRDGMLALKAAGFAGKADEVDYSTLASYGDEWVGVGYSSALWEAIRVGSWVVGRLPTVEVPQGYESINLPLESTDPVFYKVAENTTYDSTMEYPVPTVDSSRLGTGKVTLSLAKMGARVLWTGELSERSLIPFASQLRMQLQVAGQEQLEHAIIDGDTVTTATTNINDIAATGAQGGTELYLLFNGFRKSPLVTTTANSRSAAGSLAIDDFIETAKLMGGAGINALDRSKVTFIVDPLTHYAASQLEEVKTRDVFNRATLENGLVASVYGYEVKASGSICYKASNRLSNTAGKVDQDTTTNNLYGSILAVRWDQWKFGFQRRMTMETTRFAASDTNEIVSFMVVGLIQRDTEASAITYYVGV